MLPIETERLTLRRFAEGDWGDFHELAVDWAAAPGPAFDKWPTTEESARKSVAHMATTDRFVAVVLRDAGKVIGLLGANGVDERKRLDMGHVILSTRQDDDLDREALAAMVRLCFETNNIDAIVTHNDPAHAAQLAPLRSLGFIAANPDDPGELTLTRETWGHRP